MGHACPIKVFLGHIVGLGVGETPAFAFVLLGGMFKCKGSAPFGMGGNIYCIGWGK